MWQPRGKGSQNPIAAPASPSPLPALVTTYLFNTAISFSRLLSRKAGDFLMHFRAKSFPVTLCFTRNTSEKAPLWGRGQDRECGSG